MGEVAANGANIQHTKEVLHDTFIHVAHRGERQNLEGKSKAAAHWAKRLQTRENNIMPIVSG